MRIGTLNVAINWVLLANRIARSIGTVTSDLLCAVSQRVERVYVR